MLQDISMLPSSYFGLHTTPLGGTFVVEVILSPVSPHFHHPLEFAYVATMVLVVVVVVMVLVLTVRVGVGAVMVIVVLALPEYAVTGGGVLKLLAHGLS